MSKKEKTNSTINKNWKLWGIIAIFLTILLALTAILLAFKYNQTRNDLQAAVEVGEPALGHDACIFLGFQKAFPSLEEVVLDVFNQPLEAEVDRAQWMQDNPGDWWPIFRFRQLASDAGLEQSADSLSLFITEYKRCEQGQPSEWSSDII